MKTKKLLVLFFALALMLVVVACGSKETEKKGKDNSVQETVQNEEQDDEEQQENTQVIEDEDEKTETKEDTSEDESAVNIENSNTQSTVEKVTMYAKSSLNVRSGAGTSHATVGNLSKGQEVVKVGEENGWSKIEFNGMSGYVNSKYLSKEKVSTSTANSNAGNNNGNNSTKPSASTQTGTSTNTKPSVTECEHWYQPEFKEYTKIEHYIFGCNGCGYPLFTIQNHDAVNLPDLYSHPPYYSEKLGRECTGGAYHSEWYYQGYCALCYTEIQLRNCTVFYVMGETCVKNEVLGAYEKVETGRYPCAYLKSCDCGNNVLLGDGREGVGLLIIKETCKYCGDVKTYPQK